MADIEIDFQKYETWIEEGQPFALIRDDLEKKGLSPGEIKKIIREIDEHVVNAQLQKINKRAGRQGIVAGAILTIVSIALFFAGFLPFLFFAVTGFTSGIGLILWGKKKMKGTNADAIQSAKKVWSGSGKE